MTPFRMRQKLVFAVCLSALAVLSGCGTSPSDSITLAPVASLSVSSLTFAGTTAGATSSAQTVTLSNTGTAGLAITGISITGANPTDFAETNNCGTSLAVSTTCTISVTFIPASAASFSASISIADNATGSPQSVALTGVGTAPLVPQAVLSPVALNFASQTTGTSSAARTVTLSNIGNTTLNIAGILIAGANPTDFVITGNTCGATLAAASSCSIAVTFTPQSVASFTATLTVTDNSPTPVQTTALSGAGSAPPAPVASLSPSTIAFPTTSIGTTALAQTLTLANTGNAPLTISSISLGGSNPTDFADSTTCAATLAASSSCSIAVTFTPQAAVSYTATITVVDNATGSPQVATLAGTGTPTPAPIASLSPGTITFPSTPVGSTSAAQTVTLSNTGNATLNIGGISLAGANSSDFAETTTCGSTLAASSTCTFAITFTPASTSTYTATLTVSDNATGSPQTATLTGTGSPTPAPIASLSSSTVTFPNTYVGANSPSQTLTLSNTGNATLNITGILITGAGASDFTETTTCGATLAASSTCNITLTFNPASVTTFSATLNITDNAANSPQTATLTGTGTAAPGPLATLSPTTLTLPSTTIGATSPARTITLSNSGNAALNITSIAIGGSNPTDFAETNNCGATLAIASSCTISITFTPISANTLTASLIVTDNNNPATQTANLTGTGVLTPTGAFVGTAFTGQVLAGNLPVIGATVQIYTAGTSGNGSAGAQRLDTSLVTDTNGAFSVSAPYTCPLGSSILYIVATGGQAGTTGTPNSSTVLLSSPGACSNIAAGASYTLNELTTVASAYAFSQFLSTGAQLGSTATNSSGIALAAGTLANLVDISAGASPGPAFPSSGTIASTELNALANLLNACIVSTGSGSSACSGFFSNAAIAGVPPTNTLDAIMNIAKNPAVNVSALYTLSAASRAYTPVPTVSPRDWTLFVNFTGGGMNAPTAIAIDSAGRVWVASYNEAASLFSNTGVPAFPSGITGHGLCETYGAAVDANDHFWAANLADCGASSVTVLNTAGTELANYTAGGIYYPYALAFDSLDNAWIDNYGNSRLIILTNGGTPLSGPSGYNGVVGTVSNFEFPVAIAVDSNNNGWLADDAGGYVTKVSADGSSYTKYTTGGAPDGIAIDASNNVWIADYSLSSLFLINSAGTLVSGANGYPGGGLYYPQSIAVDGAGNAWAASYHTPNSNYGDALAEFSSASSATPGTPLSPSTGYGTNAGLVDAFSLAIDAAGNIWVSSHATNTLTEFVGLAAPAKTPLLGYTHTP